MDIKTKFEVGEKVYNIYNRPKGKKCPDCEGKGTLFLQKGRCINCAKCKGTGEIKDWTNGSFWEVNTNRREITECNICIIGDGEGDVTIEYNFEDDNQSEEDDLFLSLKAAKLECAIRNSKGK